MKKGYGQYCPLALAAELLGQRWTILVISRLIDGCTTFNEIHRGVPRISPSMLSRRLAEIEDGGLIVRRTDRANGSPVYELTEAGRQLEGVIMDLAVWGQHWARDLSLDDLDPAFLAWSMHTRLNLSEFPPGRTVMEFEFSGTPKGTDRFWLVVEGDSVDMCLKHPGYETDLHVASEIRRFVETWRGFRDLGDEIDTGHIRLRGPQELRRQFPQWLQLSALAPYERKRPGTERRVAQQRPWMSRAAS